MSYTHYFTQKKSFTAKQWQKIQDGTTQILLYCKKQGINTQYNHNDKRPAEVSAKAIHFNGADNLGHEDFVLPKALPEDTRDGEYFAFCKTNRNPYDLAVCLVLLWVKAVAPKALDVGSDGNNEAWEPALAAYKEVFNVSAPTAIDTLPV